MSRKLFALGGWGVPPGHVATLLRNRFPDTEITVESPTEEHLARALATDADVTLAGWSLGAHLLLRAAADNRVGPGRRLLLFSPFDAFPVEAGSGGRVALTQVKFLRRMLRRDPLGALRDFHRRAGLTLPESTELPYDLPALEHGLDLLENLTPPSPLHFGGEHVGVVGAGDTLLDAEALAARHPGLRVAPAAGHDLAELLASYAS